MIQASKSQGKVWQAALRSQNLSVIWEEEGFPLMQALSELQQADQDLPDLLLIDLAAKGNNPYAFCRWCREHCPSIKIILTNSKRSDISSSELRWAVHQGAEDLLPRFQRREVMIGVTYGIKRVLESLNQPALDQKGLSSVLHQLATPHHLSSSIRSARSDDTIPLFRGSVAVKTPVGNRGLL